MKPKPIETTPPLENVPDGNYPATWGGYVVRLIINGKLYEIKTDIGVRTLAWPCTVSVRGGVVMDIVPAASYR